MDLAFKPMRIKPVCLKFSSPYSKKMISDHPFQKCQNELENHHKFFKFCLLQHTRTDAQLLVTHSFGIPTEKFENGLCCNFFLTPPAVGLSDEKAYSSAAIFARQFFCTLNCACVVMTQNLPSSFDKHTLLASTHTNVQWRKAFVHRMCKSFGSMNMSVRTLAKVCT